MSEVSQFSTLAAALEVSKTAAAVKKAEDFRSEAQVCEERAEKTSDQWVISRVQNNGGASRRKPSGGPA